MVDPIDFAALMREERRKAASSRVRRSEATGGVGRGSILPSQSSTSKADAMAGNDGQHQQDTIFNSKVSTITRPITTKNTTIVGESADTMMPAWSFEPSMSSSSAALCPNLEASHSVSGSKVHEVSYIPRYITETHQQSLLSWLQSVPDARNEQEVLNRWNTMRHGKRRVLMVQEPSLPVPIRQLADCLVQSGVFPSRPNHVLINEYEAGQGILPHTDGPVYEAQTATLSIGGTDVLFNFTPRLASHEIGSRDGNEGRGPALLLQLLLEGNGSLVVFRNEAYTDCCHGIRDNVLEEIVETEPGICVNAKGGTVVRRGYRISLTFRIKKDLS